MARQLSDAEHAQFMSDVNVAALNLPPWGGVVAWNGLDVLVFVALGDGRVWTTDITDDFQSWIAANENQQATYDPNSQVWYYQIPQQTAATIVGYAQKAGDLAAQGLNIIGQAAAAAAKPTIDELSPYLIAGVVILGLFLFGRR